MSSENSRAQRFRVTLAPAIMDRFLRSQGAWFETADDTRERLRRNARHDALMAWVVARMPELLTTRERQCIDLHYFRGLSYREIGEATSTNKTSAFRAVERGIRKLREAKEKDRSWERALERLKRR
jgi:RNA polymerase sigma factor (sigma-70 family)